MFAPENAVSDTSSNTSSATPENLLKTPLHDLHVEFGARMVPFAGYSMPVQYLAGLMVISYVSGLSLGLRDLVYAK